MRRIVLAAVLAAPFLASAANLVANGSFEDTVQGAGSWNIYSNLPGWTGGSAGIELRNAVAGAAFDGVNFVELDTTQNSLMFQNIATNLGQGYKLSFAYAPRTNVSSASNGIEVFWNGATQGVFTGNGFGGGDVWSVQTMTLTGAALASKLEFRAVGDSDSYGGSLDAVSLTSAVPEPGTYALMLGGLGALVFVARRRRVF